MKEKKPSRHPLVFLAFILALLVFILPTHTDLMFAAIMAQRPVTMAAVTAICFAVVLVPQIAGSFLTGRHPERWRRSKLAIATWVILGLAVLFNCFGWITLAKHEGSANQTMEGTK